MRIIIANDYADLSKKAANIIAAQLLIKPNSVLGLATGSSPTGTYEKLVECYKNGDISFKEASTINLDEYLGLASSSEQSYHYFMRKNLFDHVDIIADNTHIPNGMASDIAAECKRYDQLLVSLGGIDLQLLGIGGNGHIAFNEPDDYIANNTYCVDLTKDTISANTRFFAKEEDVPKKAFTMGIGSIMRSKKAVMIVSGSAKAEILKAALLGPVSPQVPASLMRMHPDFIIIADEAAAALIKDSVV